MSGRAVHKALRNVLLACLGIAALGAAPFDRPIPGEALKQGSAFSGAEVRAMQAGRCDSLSACRSWSRAARERRGPREYLP
jgi:hypothetical protein